LVKKKYKKKLKKYAKRARHAYDTGAKIWNRLNTTNNRKKLASTGKRATQVSQNLMDIL
jgi:hypothetical protein